MRTGANRGTFPTVAATVPSGERSKPDGRVSVVLITHNRARSLAGTLDALVRLPEAPRLIVVDNASSDDTASVVADHAPAATLVGAGANLGGAGRNLGVRTASTDYVAFCDDDTWWSPGSLRIAADLLDAHPRVAVVTAHILVEPAGTDDPICAELRASPLPVPEGVRGFGLLSFLAGASVVRRSAFLAAGGFDPHLFIGGEEEHLAAALAGSGWAMVHLPEAVVHHLASPLRRVDERRQLGIRNTLWFAWSRRPVASAARRSWAMARRVPLDWVSAGGFASALRGVPWVLRHREVVPAHVERGLRLLDRGQLDGPARRYVSSAPAGSEPE